MKSDQMKLEQIFDLVELMGFDSCNKYQIENQNGSPIGYAAEKKRGFFKIFLGQFFKRLQSFEILLFNVNREQSLNLRHSNRWLFQRLEILDESKKKIGLLQQRFSIFYRHFQIEDEEGKIIFDVKSPIIKWMYDDTFTFKKEDREVAEIVNKSHQHFNYRDDERDSNRFDFFLTVQDKSLAERERLFIISAGIFIDLMYFENSLLNFSLVKRLLYFLK